MIKLVIKLLSLWLKGYGNKNYFFTIGRSVENQLQMPFPDLHYLPYFLRYLRTKMAAHRHLGYAYPSPNMHDITTG